MQIVIVAGKFPAPSETFVVDQVTALLRLGHEVRIVANHAGRGAVHQDVRDYALLERTAYRPAG